MTFKNKNKSKTDDTGTSCFLENTSVLTDSGYKNIQDVNKEDRLLSHTGKFRRILQIYEREYHKSIYKFRISRHPIAIECTKGHPFYVRKSLDYYDTKLRVNERKYGEPEWKQAKDIKEDDYFGMVINNKEEIPEFIINKEKIKLNRKSQWFVIGYFFANTFQNDLINSIYNKYSIKFNINKDDEKEVFEKLIKILPADEEITEGGKISKRYKVFKFTNQLWHNIFSMFKDRYLKIIPEFVQNLPVILVQSFIDGYIKAYGNGKSNARRGKTISVMSTTSVNLMYSIQRLYFKIGFVPFIDSNTPRANYNDCYRVCISSRHNDCFIEDNYVWFRILRIKKIRYEDEEKRYVYNFEVNKDNSYVVENIVTHNCSNI